MLSVANEANEEYISHLQENEGLQIEGKLLYLQNGDFFPQYNKVLRCVNVISQADPDLSAIL